MKTILNVETGEETQVEFTAEELAQQEIDSAMVAQKESEKATLEKKKQEVLKKLGLTAEEVAALLA